MKISTVPHSDFKEKIVTEEEEAFEAVTLFFVNEFIMLQSL